MQCIFLNISFFKHHLENPTSPWQSRCQDGQVYLFSKFSPSGWKISYRVGKNPLPTVKCLLLQLTKRLSVKWIIGYFFGKETKWIGTKESQQWDNWKGYTKVSPQEIKGHPSYFSTFLGPYLASFWPHFIKKRCLGIWPMVWGVFLWHKWPKVRGKWLWKMGIFHERP